MKKVIILAGVSGAGKSTYAEKRWPEADVCSADGYFVDKHGFYNFNPMLIGDAHAWCLRKYAALVQDTSKPAEYTVVVDNTNTTVAEIAPYAALALAYSYSVEVVIIECSAALGGYRNKHGVPTAVVKAQKERLHELPAHLPPRWPIRRIKAGI